MSQNNTQQLSKSDGIASSSNFDLQSRATFQDLVHILQYITTYIKHHQTRNETRRVPASDVEDRPTGETSSPEAACSAFFHGT